MRTNANQENLEIFFFIFKNYLSRCIKALQKDKKQANLEKLQTLFKNLIENKEALKLVKAPKVAVHVNECISELVKSNFLIEADV